MTVAVKPGTYVPDGKIWIDETQVEAYLKWRDERGRSNERRRFNFKKPAYVRKEVYHDLQAILSLVRPYHTKRDYTLLDGDKIKLGSDRYKTFAAKGTCCVKCGLEALFFAKERSIGRSTKAGYHLNLYGIKDDKEVLFTKDHILAKKNGGKDEIENYAPMCSPCNTKKGHKIK